MGAKVRNPCYFASGLLYGLPFGEKCRAQGMGYHSWSGILPEGQSSDFISATAFLLLPATALLSVSITGLFRKVYSSSR